MAQVTLEAGDLRAVVGDNGAEGNHRAGYNGLWSLTHRQERANIFVPAYAGLNFEHIFDGHRRDQQGLGRVFFEPRHAPMCLRRLSDAEAELHQAPTPTFGLESWTRFRLVAPHYVDMTFRFRPHRHEFEHRYIGLFWASYIHAPEDKSLYFRQGNLWQQWCTVQHNHFSTVRHREDRLDLRFSEGYPDALYRHLSPLRYEEPFYYGNFRDQVYIMMFEPNPAIRFSHSPSGGGIASDRETTNPAWDFQYVLPRYEVNREYGFRARLAYRPRCSRREIRREVATWQEGVRNPPQPRN